MFAKPCATRYLVALCGASSSFGPGSSRHPRSSARGCGAVRSGDARNGWSGDAGGDPVASAGAPGRYEERDDDAGPQAASLSYRRAKLSGQTDGPEGPRAGALPVVLPWSTGGVTRPSTTPDLQARNHSGPLKNIETGPGMAGTCHRLRRIAAPAGEARRSSKIFLEGWPGLREGT